MAERKIFGVGFLLFTINNKIPKLFTIEELKDKAEVKKEKGMLSFPLETFEEKDKTFENTIKRLLIEEVGVSLSQVDIKGIASKIFQLIPGRRDIYTVYGFGLFLGNLSDDFVPADNDVKFSGWKTIEDLCWHKTRSETVPILEHFIEKHFQELFGSVS